MLDAFPDWCNDVSAHLALCATSNIVLRSLKLSHKHKICPKELNLVITLNTESPMFVYLAVTSEILSRGLQGKIRDLH